MRRVIVVANQKGGVGKTTTVINLGAALASFGHRVIVADLDSQGALTASFGYDPYNVNPSTTNVLLDEGIALSDVLVPGRERLEIAPANAELLAAEYKLLKQADRTNRLRGAIERSNKDGYDYVIIDTPPNLGLLTVNGLVAATDLLIPVKTEYLAMRGVRPLLESVWLIRERINPGLRLLGVLPTMYQQESRYATAVVEEMRKVFKNKMLRTVIPVDEAAAVAPAARSTAIDYKPHSPAAAAYRRLAEEVNDVLK
jgi:chromosome partitioning protein